MIFIENFDKISKKVLKKLCKSLFTKLPTIFDRFGANIVQNQSAFLRNGGSMSGPNFDTYIRIAISKSEFLTLS